MCFGSERGERELQNQLPCVFSPTTENTPVTTITKYSGNYNNRGENESYNNYSPLL